MASEQDLERLVRAYLSGDTYFGDGGLIGDLTDAFSNGRPQAVEWSSYALRCVLSGNLYVAINLACLLDDNMKQELVVASEVLKRLVELTRRG